MKRLLVPLFVGLLWGAFSISQVHASTIYQQLSDSSATIQFTGVNDDTHILGSFLTNSETYYLANSSEVVGFLAVVNSHLNGSRLTIVIASTSSYTIGDPVPWTGSNGCTEPLNNSGDVFYPAAHGLKGGSSGGYLMPNTTYYVFATIDDACGSGTVNAEIRTNLSSDFYYGYITDTSGNSIPIVPGIPGFTDAGISTTSQQVFCNTNFSTSSGLLDSLGQSISLGFCNVGVFLFVPSGNALSQFQSLASTSQTKIPFSYFFGAKDIFLGLTASTTENLPDWSIDLPAFGSSTPMGTIIPTHISILSTTTIDRYYPSPIRHTFLFLGSSAIWLGVLFMFYRRIVPHKAL